jgi:16S rRNA (adenine1518-N6/adenine1519-N6)-dimethyltransferase
VLEVGPGPGGLTRALLDAGAGRVIAIERDPRCIAALSELADAAPGRLEVIEADALRFDLDQLGQDRLVAVANLPYNIGTPLLLQWLDRIERFDTLVLMFQREVAERLVAVANLPYNIGTPLLLQWLDRIERFDTLVLMFQREVAERLVAAPGTAAYGRLAVIVQWLCEVRIALHLPGRAFVPPPQVASSLVQLTPRPGPLAPADKPALERVLAAAFGQRRKMLRVSLRSLTDDPIALLEAAGVPPTARAEDIDVAGFCRLARSYSARQAGDRVSRSSGTD